MLGKIGYPVWHHKYKQSQGKQNQSKSKDVEKGKCHGLNVNHRRTAVSISSGSSNFTFTCEQFENLMRNVLKDMKPGATSGDCTNDELEFVTDIEATNHMTPFCRDVINAKILEILPKITFPNGHSLLLKMCHLNEHPLAKRGIQANLTEEKITSKVQTQRSPGRAHSLEDRLETLREFLTKGVGRSSSFFKARNKGINEISYQWSMEAEAAFQRWKEYMEIFLTVTAPAKGEILFLHLATPFDGFSAIFLAEKRNVHIPLYFASRYLQGIEQSYVDSERLILALVHATRRLRRSQTMAKWAMKLEEYDIEYGMDNFVEGQTHVSTELGKSSMSSNKGTFRAKREGKPHFDDSKKRMTLPNPKEDKSFLEPSFKPEVEQEASTE
ncbi:hypothetical protein CTI12_AA012190 [Artemisia annua]|uniref:Reverse transcriptase domain-containing protein n=1 Tax=Artemisia annua TaxID=35608 RepID=A0A2U1QL00_ARTAN|nr:hypothetical protein CTI12_AA012190 [Artemisia annua]